MLIHPWLAIELAGELAGSRGIESMDAQTATDRLLSAFEAGLRKTLARMGISTAAAYIGAELFETIELDAAVVARCFPSAAAWPGGLTLRDLAQAQLERARRSAEVPADTPPGRLVDPGRARFRADGEAHAYAPATRAVRTKRVRDGARALWPDRLGHDLHGAVMRVAFNAPISA